MKTTTSPIKITEAIHVIKDHICDKCGTQAKGFIFRKTQPIYYCRECLRQEMHGHKRLVA